MSDFFESTDPFYDFFKPKDEIDYEFLLDKKEDSINLYRMLLNSDFNFNIIEEGGFLTREGGNLSNTWAETIVARALGWVIITDPEFGAVGDGVTDDTAAIQAAIDSLPLNTADVGILSPKGFAQGGIIYFPRGKYLVSSTLTLQRGIHILGESRESSQIISKCTGSVLHYPDAGRYIQDEIVIEHLSVWQDVSVVPVSGAGIEIGFGSASVQSTKIICKNVYIEGTYVGFRLEAGVGCVFENCDASKCISHGFDIRYTDGTHSSSTTSTAIITCYASLNGGNGFNVTRGGYISWIACASDSNTGYGYYLDSGLGHHIQGGAEENTAGSIYLKNTNGITIALNMVQGNGVGAIHAISLENAGRVVLLGGYCFGGASITGYGIHQVSAGGPVLVIGTDFEGTYLTNRSDTVFKFLNLSGNNGLVGDSNKWAIGEVQQPDPLAVFNVSGVADSGSDSGFKSNSTFTGAGGVRNAAGYFQALTSNTAVVYPLVIGVFVPGHSKGAASTITRQAGFYVVESSVGGTANAAIMIDAGAGTVPAGNWAIYSQSARDSVFVGPIRSGSGTGPKWQSGAGTPEGAITAPVGSLYSRTDGGAGTSLYVKETGTGNTGWVAK